MMADVNIFKGLSNSIIDVFWSLFPMFIVFSLFQVFTFKLPKARFILIIKGLLLSFVGFSLFLHGIQMGFINTGRIIGEKIATLDYNWILIPIGFVLGIFITFAEPAIKVLINEIEKITSGYINKKILLSFLSVGVGISISLSIIRVLTSLSLWYIILPGYIIVLILMQLVDPLFTAIAFDSGGAVTGPMVASFILAINVGSSKMIESGNVLIDSFGMIGLVALIPILSILVLGLLYEKSKKGR